MSRAVPAAEGVVPQASRPLRRLARRRLSLLPHVRAAARAAHGRAERHHRRHASRRAHALLRRTPRGSLAAAHGRTGGEATRGGARSRARRCGSARRGRAGTHHRGARRGEAVRGAGRRPGTGHRAHGPGDRSRRDRRAAGPFGLRKIHAAAHSLGPHAAIERRGAVAWPAAGGRSAARGHRLPELRAVSLADGHRQRGGAAARPGPGPRRAARARPAQPGNRRPAGLRIVLSQGPFGRHEAARGICARPGRRARGPVHGRALQRPRRAHRREPPRRTDGTVAGQEDPHPRHLHGDPQHRGSRAAGRPRGGSGTQPGAHPRRIPRSPGAAARPQTPPSF